MGSKSKSEDPTPSEPNTQHGNTLAKLWSSYSKNTAQNLKIIDAYLVFIMITGILQFVYVVLAGTFPYNAFLSGFISTVGSFVLAANLRIQTNPQNTDFPTISPVRAFADFVVCSIVLQFFVVNFMG